MGLVEKANLVSAISPPLNLFLATQLLDEFMSCERRYIQRDWEPSELDGGQFCEILARILHHLDSGNLNLNKDFDDCMKYVEDSDNKFSHAIQPRRNALHLAKVARTVYKFRSQRGAVHISPTYEPNHMDSKFVIESVRWLMNETLRIFWTDDREKVAKAIREILQFDVPCIGKYEDEILVQRTDLKPEEEILVLLHFAGEVGMNRTELGSYSLLAPPAVTRAIAKLTAANCRQVIKLSSGQFRLTDLGSKRIREDLAEKLLLQ
jgi:hypothetical protein